MSELGIFYPNVPSEVKAETFIGTIDNPFGENTPVEKIGEILNALRNGNALITLNSEMFGENVTLNVSCYDSDTRPNMYGNIYGMIGTSSLTAHFYWDIKNNIFSIDNKIVLQLISSNNTFVDVSSSVTFSEITTVVKIWADD